MESRAQDNGAETEETGSAAPDGSSPAMKTRAVYVGNRPNVPEIRRTFRSDSGPVGRDLDDMTRRVQARARTLVGVRSGLILSTIRREPLRQGSTGPYRDVTAGRRGLTRYLMQHHDGTKPHTIRPRRRRALRFVSGGHVVYATRVRHPGTRGTKFLTRALEVLR